MAAQAALGDDLKTLAGILCGVLLSVSRLATAGVHVVVVEGLAGEPRFAAQFSAEVAAIEQASRTLTPAEQVRTFRSADAGRDAVLAHLEALAGQVVADDQVLVYLVGHGSYDEVEYKFNLRGPDLTGADIRDALEALPATRQLVVNTSSASGALASLLAAEGRILVLATRSGAERHATRFGGYFAEALAAPAADADKNRIVTAREAFDFAERRVADYFEREGRLGTEHARIEGGLADRIAVARLAAARPAAVVDTALAGMIDDRDALNASIDELRLARDDMTAEDYRAALLEKMLELARLEDAIEARERELGGRD
jgi:hypothetical protein